jgi:hypothetical protein
MKTKSLFIAFFTAIAFTGCSNNSTNNALQEDAKKAADLQCRIKKAELASDEGDMSAFNEEQRLTEQLTLLNKKYENDKLNFLEAVDKEMSNCKVDETKVSSSTDSKSNSSTVNDTEDSEDWDQMLDDYESFTDDYVVLYKKALKGDASALETYPELMEKAEELQKSLVNAEKSKKLGMAQLKRMTKIQTKMLQAIQNQ